MIKDKGPEKTITVIGGGPAGMTAAISAASQGIKVMLAEKNSILGRKLLATGNGRCNLTNTNSTDADVTLRFFDELGLLTREEDEGRVYPYSEQASAVQEALISELWKNNVGILCELEVQAVKRAERSFLIETNRGGFHTDVVILATGGKAGPQYGSTGDGYRFAKAFGHSIVSLRPSLVQMVSDATFFKQLKGVRAKGQVELLRGKEIVDRETGEIQFTDDGLSGICIFNLSKEYVRGDMIRLDLFPKYSEDGFKDKLYRRAELLNNRNMLEYCAGILHKKLIPVVLAELAIDYSIRAASLNHEDIANLAGLLKGWRIPITGTKGWKEAQVTSGGVDLAEIDMKTMESKLVPGLYFAGEVLDEDGKCGGYNLQWAWMSGMAAGRSAAKECSQDMRDGAL